MEMSVSFIGENETHDPENYLTKRSRIGKVYIPVTGVVQTGPIRIRYEKHPWIEKFELDGIKAAPARRTGVGTKGAKGFVQSLSTIYAPAYEEYRRYGGEESFDARRFFTHVAEYFVPMATDALRIRMFRKFGGFTENIWREGNADMLSVAIDCILPVIRMDPAAWKEFRKTITPEFLDYVENINH